MRLVTLVDLGGAQLPAQTPAAVRYSAWFPQVYAPPQPPMLAGLTATPVVDGVLLEWSRVPLPGAVYVVAIGEARDGPFTELGHVDAPRYLYSNADTTSKWFSVTPSIRGQPGVGAQVQAAPKVIASDEDLIELQRQIDQEKIDRFQGDSKEAQARADQIAEETLQREQQINTERAAREAAVAQERVRIDEMASDEVISQVEKPQLRIIYGALVDEYDGLIAQARLSEADPDTIDAFTRAKQRVVTYHTGLVSPVPWNDGSDVTYLN